MRAGDAAPGAASAHVSLHARLAGAAATGAALFDLSRGRQALLSIAGAGLAAVLAAGGVPSLRVTVIGLIAAWAGYFVAFSLNDVLDRRTDAESLRAGKARPEGFDIDTAFSRHPLAAGKLTLAVSVSWVAGLTLIAAVGCLLLSPLCLLFFLLGAGLDFVYSALRTTTWLKTVVTGVMVGCGGVAGWVAVAPLGRGVLPVFVFLALWEIGGRNLANDLSDVASDASVGVRTVATTFGMRAAARANLVVGAAMVASVAWLQMPLVAVLAALACGVWLVVRPGVALARRPSTALAAHYFNHASVYPVAVLLIALAGLTIERL